MNGNSRKERGDLQRTRFRDLVSGPASARPGGLGGPEDVERLAGTASWWSAQEQWGRQVTAPARQLLTSIRSIGSSPNQPALLFELGRLTLSFSQSVLKQMGDIEDRSATPTPQSCPICGATAPGRAWHDQGLEFLRVHCPDCRTVTTTSKLPTSLGWSWTATPGPAPSLTLHDVKIAALNIDQSVAYPAPVETVSVRPGTPCVRMLLDLAPTEIVWHLP